MGEFEVLKAEWDGDTLVATVRVVHRVVLSGDVVRHWGKWAVVATEPKTTTEVLDDE